MKTYAVYVRLIFILLLFTTGVRAQDNIIKSLESDVRGQGKVNVYQDSRIEALLGKPHSLITSGESSVIKMSGYRVQVYAGGNSRDSRRQAEHVASRVKSSYPELKVYTTFSPPRWLCRVGDFLSIEEADRMMRKLRKEGGFREASIVREQVNITL